MAKPFSKLLITGYRLPIPGATGNEFWEYKPPTVRDELDKQAKIRQLPKEDQNTVYYYVLWELAYTFKACGLVGIDSPTEDPTKEGFVPIIKPGTPEQVYHQLELLPLGLLMYLWEGVKAVVPGWGPRFTEPDEDDEGGASDSTF